MLSGSDQQWQERGRGEVVACNIDLVDGRPVVKCLVVQHSLADGLDIALWLTAGAIVDRRDTGVVDKQIDEFLLSSNRFDAFLNALLVRAVHLQANDGSAALRVCQLCIFELLGSAACHVDLRAICSQCLCLCNKYRVSSCIRHANVSSGL